MIKVNNVSAGYYKGLDILRGISMTCRDSEITAIIGPNGAGKSTLLKTIGGFLKPTQGSIFLNEKEITGLQPHLLLHRGISMVPQSSGIFPLLTVEENLQLGGWILRKEGKEAIKLAIADVYAHYPNLRDKKTKKAGDLSGGERKMLDFGRALIVDPSIVLVDEPTAGLAPKFFDLVYEDLKGMCGKSGKTVVLVDQNVKQAIDICDHVYVLEVGRVTSEGRRGEYEGGELQKTIQAWLSL